MQLQSAGAKEANTCPGSGGLCMLELQPLWQEQKGDPQASNDPATAASRDWQSRLSSSQMSLLLLEATLDAKAPVSRTRALLRRKVAT